MSRNTVENVIRKFGSQQRVAELLGIWQTAVSGWVRRGVIPTKRQEELLSIARREGVELGPADFFVEAALGDGSLGVAAQPEPALTLVAGGGRQVLRRRRRADGSSPRRSVRCRTAARSPSPGW